MYIIHCTIYIVHWFKLFIMQISFNLIYIYIITIIYYKFMTVNDTNTNINVY